MSWPRVSCNLMSATVARANFRLRANIATAMHIGRGAIVGAGAAVTENILEYEIWGGVPARKIGERS